MSMPAAAYRLVLLAICAVAPALQGDWITESELHESCDAFVSQPNSPEGSSCLAFVQGFLIGAEHLNPAVDASGNIPGEETFAERAARTRLSTAQLQRIEGTTIAPYCIDESTPVAELLEAIRDHLGNTAQDASLISPSTMQQALSRSFPCDA